MHLSDRVIIILIFLLLLTGTCSAAEYDIAITSLSVPSTGVVGWTISPVSYSIYNKGTSTAQNVAVHYYLSENPSYTDPNGDGIYALGTETINSINRGVTYSAQGHMTGIIPDYIDPGTYYLVIWVDRTHLSQDEDTSNNFRVSSPIVISMGTSTATTVPTTTVTSRATTVTTTTATPTPTPPPTASRPDLTVTGITFPVSGEIVATAGLSSVSTLIGIANQGTASSPACQVSFTLVSAQTGTTYPAGNTQIGAIPAGESGTLSLLLDIPSTVPAGTYTLQVSCDSGKTVYESNEANNVYQSSRQIRVTAPATTTPTPPPTAVSGRPDLVVTSMTFPVTGDITATAGLTSISPVIAIANQGSAASSGCSVSLYLKSSGTGIKYPVGSAHISAISPGETHTVTVVIDIPSTIPEGIYTLGIILDSGDDVTESNEANNDYQSSRQIRVAAPATITTQVTPSSTISLSGEYQIINVNYPEECIAGQEITITGKVVEAVGSRTYMMEGWTVRVTIAGKELTTTTDQEGNFFVSVTISDIGRYEAVIKAFKPDSFYQSPDVAYTTGPINVIEVTNVAVTTTARYYYTGDLVKGTVIFSVPEEWTSGYNTILYLSVKGPIGQERSYMVSQGYPESADGGYRGPYRYDDSHAAYTFGWRVPEIAGTGDYKVTASVISDLFPQKTAESKVISVTQSLTSRLEMKREYNVQDLRFTSSKLTMTFLDKGSNPIPGAKIVLKGSPSGNTGAVFSRTGTTDGNGAFTIDLSDIDLKYGGSGSADWLFTATASLDGYETAENYITIRIPTVENTMEILSVTPELDYLSDKVDNHEINFLQPFPFTSTISIRYNALADNQELDVRTTGGYVVYLKNPGQRVDRSSECQYKVEVNGNPATSSFKLGNSGNASASISLPKGINKQLDIVISGNLFDYDAILYDGSYIFYIDKDNPTLPTYDYRGIRISLDYKPTDDQGRQFGIVGGKIIEFPLQSQTFFINAIGGESYVSTAQKEISTILDGNEVKLGTASGLLKKQVVTGNDIPLKNHLVEISFFEQDKQTRKIQPTKIVSSKQIPGMTDDQGWIAMPLDLDVSADIGPYKTGGEKVLIARISSIESIDNRPFVDVPITVIEAPDLAARIVGIHVVQAAEIPFTGNSFTMPEGVETAIRVYVELTGDFDKPTSYYDLTLKCQGNHSSFSPDGYQWVISHAIPVHYDDYKDLNPQLEPNRQIIPVDFVGFRPVNSKKEEDISFRIWIDPDNKYGLENHSSSISGTVMRMKPLKLIFVPTKLSPPDLTGFSAFCYDQFNVVKETYPVSEMSYEEKENVIAPYLPGAEYTTDWFIQIAARVWKRHKHEVANWAGDSRFVIVPLGVRSLGGGKGDHGKSYPDISYAVFVRDGTLNTYTTAHEIGHTYGLYKPSHITALTESFKKQFNSLIDRFSGPEWVRFKDPGTEQYEIFPDFGLPAKGHILKNGKVYFIDATYNSGTDSVIYTEPEWNLVESKRFTGTTPFYQWRYNRWREVFFPSKHQSVGWSSDSFSGIYDIMGSAEPSVGSSQVWIDRSTYSHLMNALADPEPQELLIITGIVDANGTATIDSVATDTGLPDGMADSGDYALELLGRSGNVLYSQHFGKINETAFIARLVPFVGGTMAVRITGPDGNELDRITRSSNVPVVSMVQVRETQTAGMEVSWVASDADGDALVYTVLYSADSGNTWTTIDSEPEGTVLHVDSTSLPGGADCRVRVIADDGFLSGSAISEPFKIENKPPIVAITTGGGSYGIDEIELRAFVYDPEDGILPDEQVVWTSNRDGVLGHGDGLIATLSPGTHLITLSATDSVGSTATDTIQVTVPGTTVKPTGAPGPGPFAVFGGLLCAGLYLLARRRV